MPPSKQLHPPLGRRVSITRVLALALITGALASSLRAQTTGQTNVEPMKNTYKLLPIQRIPSPGLPLPISLSTSVTLKSSQPGNPLTPPSDTHIHWTVGEAGGGSLTPKEGGATSLDFLQPFVKQSDSASRKITVTATYLTPKREDEPPPSGEEGTPPPPPFAEVHCSPQTIEVERVYLDFLIAETEQVTDDVLVVRDEKAQPGPSDKKVIHWAKVVVKHSAGVPLPIKLESSGTKQLYFYGEQQEGKRLDPNQLQEEPNLSGETFKKLEKSFSNEDWFWIGTKEKGSGQGKFKATANAGTGYKNAPEEKTVELVPVEVKEVWSDQIAGVEVNGFPDKTGPLEYPYIFMGATSVNSFKIKIKLAAEIPAALRSQILFRWASEGDIGEFLLETGTSTLSDGVTVKLSSEFDNNYGCQCADCCKRFLIWAFDASKNGQIDASESDNLIMMSHLRRNVSTIIPCKFIPVAEADYEESKETLLDWATSSSIQFTLTDSSRHLIAFCNGEVPTYADSVQTVIKRNETGLTHPVGVSFTPTSNPGVSFKAIISKDHELSKNLIKSNALRSWLEREFNTISDFIRQDIAAARQTGGTEQLLSYSISHVMRNEIKVVALAGGSTHIARYSTSPAIESLGFGVADPDLLLCLGKVTFENLTIDFDVDMHGFVENVKVSGLANDLYDFDHEGEELLGYPARTASKVQAGFPSLGNGGKVFKTQINLGGGNPYSHPDLKPYTFFPY